mmetsp:Transcript_2933/g.6779  ORF Transcript_2933/g.6779 Transcript_2933/m.6779 type:complete len:716 (+) Transcript_2933:88-2235(+)|eukprot:CAMPEP_0197887076 /NCGR_PEP_ID=MMETSP1439-20131203/19018_1 /TAXON_ID=66791 /ORGANISM="Gonyaulax spinifera, Strain CCMP409" /LENGTH=715 /DNA_ID=CAMNT_0043506905 /DNA_START=87 /DNA_END=2234 /DNA_ORIENTATION=-
MELAVKEDKPSTVAVPDRSLSPTRIIWSNRRNAQKHITKMAQLGLHVFDPAWNSFHSGNFTECILKINGTDETMTVPVQVCTKVRDVKAVIADRALVSMGQITFVIKQGCTWKRQDDNDEVGRRVTVRGIPSFEPAPKKWPHPTAFLGAGYNGIKAGIYWAHQKNFDFVMFERYNRIGGHAWLVQANKTSKLQTEFAAFHVWFGPPWDDKNEILSYPTDWSTWPKADELIMHMVHAAERYGLTPNIRFKQNACGLDFVGKLTDPERSYQLTVQPVDNVADQYTFTCSNIYHWPGAYFTPRIIDYPGESQFGGQVGYGMNNDIPYDYLEKSNSAILGNGAFAVENIRTCCEYGVNKVYLVTRRRNLPSPRMCCWFVHQAIVPVPAAMLLRTFEKAFAITNGNFPDPWEFHSVYGTKDKSKATISSASRFGIGDVTFLACAWGRCEYVVDLCKRMTKHTLHLEGGRRLENVTVVIKALGLLADFSCDKLHKAKEFVGPWPAGDFRRIIYCDPLGMHAANFTTFSAGIGSYAEGIRNKYLLDHPQEYTRAVNEGMLDLLPRSKATDAKPAHQFDSKYMTSCSMIVEGSFPKMSFLMADMSDYMSKMYHVVNPLDKFYEECTQGWDQYQEDWWKMGFKHEYVPYPYTKEDIHGWFEEYSRTVGPITVEAKEQWENMMKEQEEQGEHSAQWDGQGSKHWWMETNSDMKYWWSQRQMGGGG